jgi:S1-C subfamily serine protease
MSEHVLQTNYHVIKGAGAVKVTLDGGQDFTGKVLGQDEDKDIAVLLIEEKDGEFSQLRPIPTGSSSDVMVGQKVYAIGNPFGLDHTLTTGIVSGIHREIQSGITGRPIQDAIQTDAAINPGNSGGPLLDSGGELIGINTAIYSPSGANSGVGFAIPSDTVKSSVKEIIENGRVIRPILGIAFAPDMATSQLGVNGILILSVKEGGPAAKAGLQGTSRDADGRLVLGDIIEKADGVRIKTSADLYRALDKAKVGQVIDLELLRKDTKEHVMVTLEENNPSTPFKALMPNLMPLP